MRTLKEMRRYQHDGYETVSYDIAAGKGLTTVQTNENDTYLERIDIDEEYQGQGIGTRAIKELANIYGTIYAAPDNENSQRLFEKIGTEQTEKYWMVDQGFGVYEI